MGLCRRGFLASLAPLAGAALLPRPRRPRYDYRNGGRRGLPRGKVYDADTGEYLPRCFLIDLETGEYGRYLLDGKGVPFPDPHRRYHAATEFGRRRRLRFEPSEVA